MEHAFPTRQKQVNGEHFGTVFAQAARQTQKIIQEVTGLIINGTAWQVAVLHHK